MRVVVTGAAGLLGWHTRARLAALTDHEIIPVTRQSWQELASKVADADAVIHAAAYNSFTPDAERENIRLAEDVAGALRAAGRPVRVVYTNTVHAGSDTPYGRGKAAAAQVLSEACDDIGGHLTDVVLPHLFGEHGRPRHNSFVATFVEAVVTGTRPDRVDDKPIHLLHTQSAAQTLLEALTTDATRLTPAGTSTSVADVFEKLSAFQILYRHGEIPDLPTDLDVDLFNTLRAALFPAHYPIALTEHADDRGKLVETMRQHGGSGQTFVSTTKPGITRGEHFHLRKIERFAVVSGRARISLRRLFHDDVVDFEVTGEVPVVVDMPTMWVHNITNTGSTQLVTLFWANELFDPQHPDTYWQPVRAMGA